MPSWPRWSSLAALGLCACTIDNPAFDAEPVVTGESETTDEPGDGDGDGDPTSTGDGDPGTSGTTSTSTSTSTTDTGSTTDATTSGDGDGDGDGGCGELSECFGECVDLELSDAHCGACGNACPEGQYCEAASCVIDGPELVVFVTSEALTGLFGGVVAADALCNTLAFTAGLDGTYYSWLAGPQNSPALDFNKTGKYVRPDGALVAQSWAELINGQLANPINLNEKGAPAEGPWSCANGFQSVWTGVTGLGEADSPNCSNWSSLLGWGAVGLLGSQSHEWTESSCTLNCFQQAPIYCFGQ